MDEKIGSAAAKAAAMYLFHVGFVNKETRHDSAKVTQRPVRAWAGAGPGPGSFAPEVGCRAAACTHQVCRELLLTLVRYFPRTQSQLVRWVDIYADHVGKMAQFLFQRTRSGPCEAAAAGRNAESVVHPPHGPVWARYFFTLRSR